MREIKFRAWDKEGMFMMAPFYLGSLNAGELYDCDWLIMQYTGLKDKNGVEIYEGDVVKYSGHYFGDSYEKECVESVEWDNEIASYPWKLTDTGFMDGPEWCEVIGNIHEDPGLLASIQDSPQLTKNKNKHPE